MFKKIFAQLNIVGQCRRYGLPVWQCPQFLFLIMGIIIMATTVISYLIGTHYLVDPEVVAFLVLSTTTILFIITYTIIKGFERLAEASKLKSDFINIVSHQLRSPLTNIKWTFELLASKEIEVPKNKEEEYFNNVKENIARMVELIDDLLIVSKIEQGTFPIFRKEISLEKIIEELISRFKIFAEASKIKVDFYYPKDLPKIFADPSLIRLVVENLIDNAIHYTKGGGKVDIKIEKKNGTEMLFIIKDNGIGIPRAEQKYIFKKFFRADNALKKKTRGSGLGLYVCRSIVKKSGGKMWFLSEEGKGTTFYFTLPIK